MANIREVFNKIFRPNDGTIKAVHNAVSESVSHTVNEADKLMMTVREVMARNDAITGRIRHVEQSRK